MRELCLDTETTGLDPKDGHKIIEIACVELVNKVKTGNFFHVYINPRRDVPADATKIHGITTEFLQDKPIFDHVVHKFLDYVKDTKIIIHNAAFDLKFLNHELRALGLNAMNQENIIDSLALARKKFPGSPASLDALCRRFGVDLSKRTKHGALLDTELLADVYIELMGGAQAGFSFDAGKVEEKIISNEVFEIVRRNIAKRDFTVSEEELAAHKAFIEKNIKGSLWY